MKRCLLSIFLLFTLSACWQSAGRFGVVTQSPIVSVSHSRASVGETVTVTIRSNLGLDADSELADTTISDVKLGVCFAEGRDTQDAFCLYDAPLESWAVVSPGGSHFKDYGDVRVERGETYPLEHTLIFTLTEAKDVVVMSWLDRDTISGAGAVYGTVASVVFE